MKVRNYEKKELALIFVILMTGIEIVLFFFLSQRKVFSYQKISGILVEKNKVLLVIEKEKRNLLYKNKYVFLSNRNLPFKIIEEKKEQLEESKKYYEILIAVKTPRKAKTNELLEFSIRDKKKSLLEMLRKVWGGG